MSNRQQIATPLELMTTGWAAWRMAAEANMVIAMRLAGMAGIWSVTPAENTRMVSEKGPAFAEAGMAAWTSAVAGQRPDQVMAAWLRPISRHTSANSRRLSKRGFRR